MFKGYIQGLDGLRSIAILWVMFGHISSTLNWDATSLVHKPVVLFANMGWTGVQLFFVLSGFLITQILLKGKGSEHQLRNFYIRRSLRIFPVYYLMLAFFFILMPMLSALPEWMENARNEQLWYWLYMHNWIRPFSDQGGFSPLWSLAIEEQYYLLWPLLVISLSKRNLIRICIFMLVSAPLSRYWLFYAYPDFLGGTQVGQGGAYDFTFARWDAIALGSLLALIKSDKSLSERLNNMTKIAMSVLTLLVVATIVSNSNFGAVIPGFGLMNQTVAALLGFFIVNFIISNPQALCTQILEFKPAKTIGKYSYAMYLFHLPLVICWVKYFQPELNNFSAIEKLAMVMAHYTALVSITFILAALSWRLFEHPLLKLKHRFS